MEPNWIKIYTTNKPYEIEFAKSILGEDNIDAFVIDKKDSSYIFGEAELYVTEENVTKAQLILTENDLL
jgi:Putative prokaryotic signal transducing protein